MRRAASGSPDTAREGERPPRPTATRTRVAAYAVHALTASGIVAALLAALEITTAAPDPRLVLLWLGLATAIDAADGPLARAVDIERNAPAIDGRTMDDIVDYLTYTFVPLLLVLRMGWSTGPAWLAIAAVALAMAASLLGFAHRMAKDERAGFFRGFPSYWNVMAYYFGLWVAYYGAVGGLAVTVSLVCLAVLTVAPVRFVYPNMAPRPWKTPLLIGGAAWGLLLAGTLPWYPHPQDPEGSVPQALMWASLVYPALYLIASVHLARRARAD